MVTYQLLTIETKNGRQLHAHLEERAGGCCKCLVSEIILGSIASDEAVYGPFLEGESAEKVFDRMIEGVQVSLCKIDPDDSISEVDSDGDYLVGARVQREYLPPDVKIKVYGE